MGFATIALNIRIANGPLAISVAVVVFTREVSPIWIGGSSMLRL